MPQTSYTIKRLLLAATAPGIYFILFYYSRNFPIINSWEHVGFFVAYFLVLPIALFFIAHALVKLKPFRPFKKYILTFLNVFTFLYLLKVFYYTGIEKDKILLAFIIAVVVAYFLYKHVLKIIVFQFVLGVLALFGLGQTIVEYASISEDWRTQPDAIAKVTFTKKPNIYLIQTDGYANFSELNKGYYNFNNSEFEAFLKGHDVTFYPQYRSNYSTTVESNVAMFNMKQHYYNKSLSHDEIYNGRNMIFTENVVLDAFKNNGYKTYYVTETPYLIANRPTMGFDVNSLPYSEMKYIRNGAKRTHDIEAPFKRYLQEKEEVPKFFFLHMLNPWHITSAKNVTDRKESERENYLERLQETNKTLERIFTLIKKEDPNALVIFMADHGGFVGMNTTSEKFTKNIDRDFQYSIFGANLAIAWPAEAPAYDSELKSSVNLFRVLFSYLSEDKTYLDHLEENGSYLIINKGAKEGIYQTIDEDGAVVFKPIKDLSF
tara:strand:- start:42377 stop:43846 length:1470 start_codon:yes stop_codon:yes gene_type:complete